jgi:hypothetical protein
MGEGESGMSQLSSKELISELRALDLPGVAPIARAAAAEIERLQATNVPKNGDVYLALVRSGYSQHEAHEIASMVESMQCQRHDCEVMRDELQELRAVHEPKTEPPFYLDGLSIEQWREHAKKGWQQAADIQALMLGEGTAEPSTCKPLLHIFSAQGEPCLCGAVPWGPDGDTRKLHVWFTEKRTDGIWHISISRVIRQLNRR